MRERFRDQRRERRQEWGSDNAEAKAAPPTDRLGLGGMIGGLLILWGGLVMSDFFMRCIPYRWPGGVRGKYEYIRAKLVGGEGEQGEIKGLTP